ncbi:hypothetical protein Droror1_Dr00022211 [Drosera rotundifolia]
MLLIKNLRLRKIPKQMRSSSLIFRRSLSEPYIRKIPGAPTSSKLRTNQLRKRLRRAASWKPIASILDFDLRRGFDEWLNRLYLRFRVAQRLQFLFQAIRL